MVADVLALRKAALLMASTSRLPIPSDPSSFAFVTNGLSFTGNDLLVAFQRNDAWVFLSEVDFNAVPIPEPEAYAMLLDGLGLLGFVFL